MEQKIFNAMELDAIGEIMNISLGSSATAASNMLDHRVDITTPKVQVTLSEDFSLGNLDPAIGVVINYVSGLEGSNIMLLKRSDIKVIVDVLMGYETPDEEFELNELTVSAVCELMNQMMGAASTSLSEFLDRMVNISTPQSFELSDLDEFRKEHFPVAAGPIVVVRFTLKIEDALESEFLNIMSVDLARELISGFGILPDDDEPEPAPAPAPAPTPAAPEPAPMTPDLSQPMAAQPPMMPQQPMAPDMSQPMMQQPMMQQPMMPQQPMMQQPMMPQQPMAAPPGYGYPAYPAMDQVMQQMQQMQQQLMQLQAQQAAEPKMINAQAVPMPQLNLTQKLGEEQAQNLDLIMAVPLEVSVEIGRTHRKVQDILTFTKGSLVVLDKLAGDQVDLFVNGKCIARGDVVVVDDNFGIRITEILQKPALAELTGQT